ncbi:TPA: sigma 54-interacting transcriptional regulator, partial [Klebsiella pneumoniae]|nr:sigma 54-interacting transcriptional regulator [Klebsiella pneumoniae]
SLIESELFGYQPGAFTGASKNGYILAATAQFILAVRRTRSPCVISIFRLSKIKNCGRRVLTSRPAAWSAPTPAGTSNRLPTKQSRLR